MFFMKNVVVSTHELDRPARVASQDEDHVADGGCLVLVHFGDDGVQDEVALGLLRLPFRVGLTKGVMPRVGAHARDLADAVGTESGHDVIGPAVVQRLGVGADGSAYAFGNPGKVLRARRDSPPERRRRIVHVHSPLSEAEVDDRSLEGVDVDRLKRWEQLLVGKAGQEAVNGPLEVRDAPFIPF